MNADLMDAAYAAVLRRHPDLRGDALRKKARRVAGILAHSQDGTVWT